MPSAAATEIEELRHKLAEKTKECLKTVEEQKESSAACAPQREKHVAAMHRLMAALQSPNAPIVTQK